MSLASVRAWLAENAPDLPVIEVEASTATVLEAADALGVEPGRIAKTLAIRAGGETFLLVTRGDARLDNQKSKARFDARPRMLGSEETLALTGHPVGGVCPFGLATPLPVYLDVSLRDYVEVFPAAGSLNSSVRVAPERLAALVSSGWVDLCRLPDIAAAPGVEAGKETSMPQDTNPTDPPGQGESLDDTAKDAVEELKKREGEGHAGTGDIG